MNKTKMTLIAVGGVLAVIVLAAAAFTYLAWAGKSAALEGDDETEGLEAVVEAVEQLSRKAVFPCAESVKTLTDSLDEVKAWKDESLKLVARGDRPIPPTTDAQFKSMIVGDARYLATLPEGSTNKIVAADFDFGPFKPYISEGAMPEAAQLKKLQREWDDFKLIVETLLPCGVTRVTRLEVKAVAAAEPVEAAPRKGAKKGAKKPAKVEETFKPDSRTYVIGLKATPAAFVKTLNALATIDRFAVVEDFSLALERDAIASALGGEKKEEAQTSGRRRRRAVAEEESTAAEGAAAPKVQLVTDPASDATFDAVVTVTVHDFKSLEEVKEEGEEAK